MTLPFRYAYIGRTPGCGCVVAATVDDTEHPARVAKDVAGFIRDGMEVERVRIDAARPIVFEGPCYSDPAHRLTCAQQAALVVQETLAL